jgi:hypothetical protein
VTIFVIFFVDPVNMDFLKFHYLRIADQDDALRHVTDIHFGHAQPGLQPFLSETSDKVPQFRRFLFF